MVQQPINSANTSNWSSKSKGAIPVMFQLQTAAGPAVFQSIGSDTDTSNDYAYMSFAPDGTIKVKNGAAGSVHFVLDVNGYLQ